MSVILSLSYNMAAASVMASLALKPSPFPFLDRSRFPGVRPSARSSSFRVLAKKTKKIQASQPFGQYIMAIMAKKTKRIQTSQPYGPAGGLNLKDGVDASGRRAKGKGVYQFTKKYGGNVDGYSPIYNPEEWSPTGDVYAGGKTGLLLWAVTFAGLLLGGALLIYNTSALSS